MLLGVAVIAVPLLFAISNAALQIQQAGGFGAASVAITEGIGSARASEDLMSGVLLLERATRALSGARGPQTAGCVPGA